MMRYQSIYVYRSLLINCGVVCIHLLDCWLRDGGVGVGCVLKPGVVHALIHLLGCWLGLGWAGGVGYLVSRVL